MMSDSLEVPNLADLSGFSVEVVSDAEPGVVSVTAWSNDGSVVTLTWDEIARSAHVRWVHADDVRLIVERETVTKVAVREEGGVIEFQVSCEAEGLAGQFVVRVGDHVTASDALLRV